MSLEKVRKALAEAKAEYVKVPARDLYGACQELGPEAVAPGTLGEHAKAVCETGLNGPDTLVAISRRFHAGPFTTAPQGG